MTILHVADRGSCDWSPVDHMTECESHDHTRTGRHIHVHVHAHHYSNSLATTSNLTCHILERQQREKGEGGADLGEEGGSQGGALPPSDLCAVSDKVFDESHKRDEV